MILKSSNATARHRERPEEIWTLPQTRHHQAPTMLICIARPLHDVTQRLPRVLSQNFMPRACSSGRLHTASRVHPDLDESALIEARPAWTHATKLYPRASLLLRATRQHIHLRRVAHLEKTFSTTHRHSKCISAFSQPFLR